MLLFDEPTRGIDVGAKAAIHDLMRDLARQGRAIVMISSELPELIGLSDRIVVLHEGRIAGELAGRRHRAAGHRPRRRPRRRRGGVGMTERSEVQEHSAAAATTWRVREAIAGTPIWAALVGIVAVGWLVVTLDGGTFFASGNLTNILQRSVALGIVAVGQTVAILAGSLDLSVSYLISLASLVGAETMDGRESMLVPAIALTLALGAGVGLVNGLIITKLRVNAVHRHARHGARAARLHREQLRPARRARCPSRGSRSATPASGPIPVSIFLFAGVALVVGLALRRTRFGYHVYAVGGDEQVSVLSGLRTHRVVIAAHVICSVCAALTGLFLASRLGSGTPRVGTDGGYDLESIAAVVLGGTALAGGRGRVAGTVGAVLVLAVLDNIFNQLELDPFLKQAVRGVVIIAAVAVYALRRRDRPQVATGTAAGMTDATADARRAPSPTMRRGARRGPRVRRAGLALGGPQRPDLRRAGGAAGVDRHREPELHRAARVPRLPQAGGPAGRARRRAVLRDRDRRVRPVGRVARHGHRGRRRPGAGRQPRQHAAGDRPRAAHRRGGRRSPTA